MVNLLERLDDHSQEGTKRIGCTQSEVEGGTVIEKKLWVAGMTQGKADKWLNI